MTPWIVTPLFPVVTEVRTQKIAGEVAGVEAAAAAEGESEMKITLNIVQKVVAGLKPL